MYKSNVNEYQEYVAPVLGNGSVCFQADYEGCMSQERRSDKISNNPSMKIWRAGRRKIDNTLLPFGYFYHKFGKKTKLCEYKQELDVENAVVKTNCVYDNGSEIISEIAAYHDFPLIMIRRKIKCLREFEYSFEYRLDNSENDLFIHTETGKNGIDIKYSYINGKKGVICLFSDMKSTAKTNGDTYSLTVDIPSGETEVAFYILLYDDIDDDNYLKKAVEIREYVLNTGFLKLLNLHKDKWNEYYREGYVVTDDKSINKVYNTAQYHLKCYTTKWSIPVGICDELWHGRYFAFDEFYMFMPLLSSNHIKSAYKPPHFRAEGLKKAIKRASSPHGVQQARYPWETLESGDEGSPVGYWYDHVFQMACIAMTEYYYYKYTNDKTFLEKEGYPVIRACALFYINQMLFKSADGTIKVAKCTDLERLGASVSNGYMTMCGIIKTIKIFCETAGVLGLDDAREYEKLPDILMASLPNDGEKYIPYEGCSEKSIGLISGIYPFDVIDKKNEMQRKGIESYFTNENKTGNMYAVGTGVCPWYRVWKAIVLARLGETEEAYLAVKSTVENTGNFDEMYEINDCKTGVLYRPWFGTASGMFIQAVNEMFVKYENGLIYIGVAIPKEIKDFSFRLAVPTGFVVEAKTKNGCMAKLKITSRIHRGNIDVAVHGKLSPENLCDVNIKKSIGDYKIIQCKVMEE